MAKKDKSNILSKFSSQVSPLTPKIEERFVWPIIEKLNQNLKKSIMANYRKNCSFQLKGISHISLEEVEKDSIISHIYDSYKDLFIIFQRNSQEVLTHYLMGGREERSSTNFKLGSSTKVIIKNFSTLIFNTITSGYLSHPIKTEVQKLYITPIPKNQKLHQLLINMSFEGHDLEFSLLIQDMESVNIFDQQ